jgi:hypothetical protein
VCSENGALDVKVYAATCAREWNGCGINDWLEGIATVQKIAELVNKMARRHKRNEQFHFCSDDDNL